MDTHLAPVLPNIFMGIYKSKWLNEYNLNKLEILVVFDKEQDSLNFSDFLNKAS